MESRKKIDTSKRFAWKKATTADPQIKGMSATAPRPHWVTIILGLFAPSIAIIAVTISLQSLKSSSQAVLISQRAYLHADISAESIMMLGVIKRDVKRYNVSLLLKFKNSGNTPAIISKFEVASVQQPGTVVFDPISIHTELSECPDSYAHLLVNGKEEATLHCANLLFETDEPILVSHLAVKMVYEDVFHQTHQQFTNCAITYWLHDSTVEPGYCTFDGD